MTEQTDPEWPQVEERAEYDLVTMPADWPVQPLLDELQASGRKILKVRKSGDLVRVRVSKPAPPPDEGEPLTQAAA